MHNEVQVFKIVVLLFHGNEKLEIPEMQSKSLLCKKDALNKHSKLTDWTVSP